MTSTFFLRAGAAAVLLAAAGAQAASVTCQSRNHQREDCRLRGDGEVVLARQLSSTECVKGRNWDETRSGVYVTAGCGGVFETRGGWNDGRPPGGDWNGPPGGTNDGWRDLIGERTGPGELALRQRGFHEMRSEPAPGGRLGYWRSPRRDCIEVRVAGPRFQNIRPVDQRACDGGWPGPAPGPGPTGGSPQARAEAVCLNQPPEGEAGDGRIERSTRLGSGEWEILVRYPSGRFACSVNARGQLRSYAPAR